MGLSEWVARHGPEFGYQSPGYQLGLAAADRYAQMIEMAPLHPAKARDYNAQLQHARDALKHRNYELARAEMHHLRNELCQELPLSTVCGELVEEISDDLDHFDGASANAKRAELGQLRILMLEKLCGNGTINEAELRVRVRALSQSAAQAHDAYWLKTDLTRNRLEIMGIALVLALFAVLIVFPPGLLSGLRQGGDPRERYLWLVMIFGAMGGLISAMMDGEPTDTSASEYYINRRLLYLRPLIGAALAVVIYFALTGNLIAIKGIGANPLDPSNLAIAFASGFAERAFVQQLLKVAGLSASEQPSTS
jgi:hypothetical protein